MILRRSIVLAAVLVGAGVLGFIGPTEAGAVHRSNSSSPCVVSPDPVASGGALTVSGKAGRSGDWVNAYLYYSDGSWVMLGGSIGGGGSFSLSGTAVATQASLWGPFYPAPSGPATVQIYAGSANRDLGMVETCRFSVS